MPELAGIETVLFLQSIDLFRFCSAEQILRLAAISHERRFSAGDSIFKFENSADVLLFVVRGMVALEGSEGDREEIGPLSPFGVEEILCGRLRARSARALTDTLVLAMDAEDFFDLLANNIEIVRALFRRYLPAPSAVGELTP